MATESLPPGSVRSGAARFAQSRLREYLMPERKDWNMIGPPIPGWFRCRLEEIDPALCTQYIPPDTEIEGGCNGDVFPFGIVTICRKMRNTGWLYKRWVYGLINEDGIPVAPTWALLNSIRIAHFDHQNFNRPRLEDKLERHCRELKRAKAADSKARLMGSLAKQLSAMDIRGRSESRVFFAA